MFSETNGCRSDPTMPYVQISAFFVHLNLYRTASKVLCSNCFNFKYFSILLFIIYNALTISTLLRPYLLYEYLSSILPKILKCLKGFLLRDEQNSEELSKQNNGFLGFTLVYQTSLKMKYLNKRIRC